MYFKKLKLFLLCIWVLKAQMLFAFFDPFKLYIRNVGISNGLSQCVLNDLYQDDNGFLWLATLDGLNRFDGNNIKTFRHDPDDQTTLISSKIYNIISDDNNHLFLNTPDGICYFDCRTEKIYSPPFLKKITPIWIGKSSSKYHFWVYTNEKMIVKVNGLDMSFIEYLSLKNINQPNLKVIRILESDNIIYIVLANGDIIVYETKTKLNKRIISPKEFTVNWGNASFDKYKNIIITSKESDLLLFDTKKMKFTKSDFYDKNKMLIGVGKVVYDSLNDLLYLPSYGQGLFVYDYKTNEVMQYKSKNSEFPISSNYILTMQINKSGFLFIGYDGSGVDIVDPYVKKFKPIISTTLNEKENIKYVRKIVELQNKELLIGTSESGLVKYNRNINQFTFYTINKNYNDAYFYVLEMFIDGNKLWVGFNGQGLGILDVNTFNILKRIKPGQSEYELSGGTIWSIFKENEHSLWVGTNGSGLNNINLDNNKITKYTGKDYEGFDNNGIRTIQQYQEDKLLLGTEKGVYIFNTKNKTLTKQFPKNDKGNSFKTIKSIFQDYKKRFWLCTDGGGIAVVDTNFNLIKNFNTNNGLNNNVVYGILPENKNTFWISSNSGICKISWDEECLYQKKSLFVHCYDEINGLQSNEFNTGAFTLLSDSSMAFGGLNGINIFNPKDIKINNLKPKIYFTEFKIFENFLQSDTNISYLDNISLSYFENSISIGFSAVGALLPGKILYKYRLLGYEKNWVTPTDRNYVSYTNLPSGKYQFQVLAMNYDGVWNDIPKTLNIFIATPFYKTWWFYFLASIIIGALIYLFYLHRVRQIRGNEKLKIQFTKELAEVEMKALRAQINPHFIFNSLNTINNFILKNDSQNASKYLIKFSQLVRNILNNSSTTFVTIQEELNTIELYLIIESIRFGNQFTYKIETEEGLNTKLFYIPSLLLQPYIENAIWHGLLHKEDEKHILITIKRNNGKSIAISILDNGIGREKAALIKEKKYNQKSFGMELGENRLRLLSRSYGENASVNVVDLYNNQRESIGTRIDIIIPIKTNVIESI